MNGTVGLLRSKCPMSDSRGPLYSALPTPHPTGLPASFREELRNNTAWKETEKPGGLQWQLFALSPVLPLYYPCRKVCLGVHLVSSILVQMIGKLSPSLKRS